jgi:hypothetical protein
VHHVAAALDDAAAGLIGRAMRADLKVPIRDRGDDYVQASFGAWLVLTLLVLLGALLIGPNDSWPWSLGAAGVVSVPAGMAVLRGVYDRARGRYTSGGLPFLFALVVSFLGALAALQPIG